MEAKLASELRSKAVDMLRSNRELCQSHAEDIGLDYLWEGDEYGSLDSRLKEMEKNSVCGDQREILALHMYWKDQLLSISKTKIKQLNLADSLIHSLAIFFTTMRKKTNKDNKKEFDVKFTPLVTLLLLGPGRVNGTWLLFLSWITNDTEEVKLNFMERSGSLFSFRDEEEKWISMSTIIHKCSVPCMDGRMRYSFDAVDIKNIREKNEYRQPITILECSFAATVFLTKLFIIYLLFITL